MSPAATPMPIAAASALPTPPPVEQAQGSKPKVRSTTPTFLGSDATANAPGSSSGATFLGQ